jgi:flotillin
MNETLVMVGSGVVAALIVVIVLAYLRRVVDPNQVHIVQSAKATTSYGISTPNGNVYYSIPAWVPKWGITTVILPVSNFDLSLNNYDAYDQDRVPLVADVAAFFRIEDTNVAAQRVSSIAELEGQLKLIVQGAIRTILASHTIDQIMMERDTFGDSFTKAVAPELQGWGVIPVKNLELMDIRDSADSQVIQNIMAKKKSQIEMESRVEVAGNHKQAEQAEIEARKEVDLAAIDAKQLVDVRDIDAKQKVDQQGIEANRVVDLQDVEAKRLVGEATADTERTVGMANEKSKQDVAEAAAVTAEKDMSVKRVNTVRDAEITRDQAAIDLEEAGYRADAVVKEGTAEAEKRKLIFEADNALEIRLDYQMKTSVGVAEAIANGGQALVPEVYIGGGDGESGPSDATQTLGKLMTLQLAQNATDGTASTLAAPVAARPAARRPAASKPRANGAS